MYNLRGKLTKNKAYGLGWRKIGLIAGRYKKLYVEDRFLTCDHIGSYVCRERPLGLQLEQQTCRPSWVMSGAMLTNILTNIVL